MPAYKDEQRKTWYVQFYYSDLSGEQKKKKKRGFKTRKEALDWERDFLNSLEISPEITFENLTEKYLDDMSTRLKKTTIEKKKNILKNKVLPSFGKFKINDITPIRIRNWQNELLKQNYSQTYLKGIHDQLTSVLNYAVKYYGLKSNPTIIAGSMGKKKAEDMDFWTLDEFKQFISVVDNTDVKLSFNILFWSGIRIGELMALTPKDIDTKKSLLDINKTYTKINSQEIITEPKTPKSKRIVYIPDFLCKDINNYLDSLFEIENNERIFSFAKTYLGKQLKKYAAISDVKKIRVHDIRHSHASLLINMDVNVLTISERLGHEKVDTTWNTYSHLYPNKQLEVAKRLEFIEPN
ncbi:tyrosine-type recombinase/integrase [Metaclostridioides mangenotii]|uniref:tyrosine-type recombinase/integrase n=1 Tax=Metaclostridioides mangenotii TaxID=1540 RepID=UPI0026F2D91C|nr:site-specific integrase [Clostridioides mangenotii]